MPLAICILPILSTSLTSIIKNILIDFNININI